MEFDRDVIKRWEELIQTQRREMDELGVPYFGNDTDEDMENRWKMMAFLEDLISDGVPCPYALTVSNYCDDDANHSPSDVRRLRRDDILRPELRELSRSAWFVLRADAGQPSDRCRADPQMS